MQLLSMVGKGQAVVFCLFEVEIQEGALTILLSCQLKLQRRYKFPQISQNCSSGRIYLIDGKYGYQQQVNFIYPISELIITTMFDWLRRIVAGAKNRMVNQHYDLDLTYITDRIIAMAFPGSCCQSLYRNDIEDVSLFLEERHQGKYFVINLSQRRYEYSYFGGRVRMFQWSDHQAPCLSVLFQVVAYAASILRDDQENVVVVHCNHGKGRTGTAIMSLLLYLDSTYTNTEEVQHFYNKTRFSSQNYKIDQPCQLRYLSFFKKIMDNPFKHKIFKTFRLVNIRYGGLSDKHYLRITQTRNRDIVANKVNIQRFEREEMKVVLMGDLFIEVMERGAVRDSRISRINFNLAFLKCKKGVYSASFQGKEVSGKKEDYQLVLQFEQYCKCYQKASQTCPCNLQRKREQYHWQSLLRIIKDRHKYLQPVEIELITNTHQNIQI